MRLLLLQQQEDSERQRERDKQRIEALKYYQQADVAAELERREKLKLARFGEGENDTQKQLDSVMTMLADLGSKQDRAIAGIHDAKKVVKESSARRLSRWARAIRRCCSSPRASFARRCSRRPRCPRRAASWCCRTSCQRPTGAHGGGAAVVAGQRRELARGSYGAGGGGSGDRQGSCGVREELFDVGVQEQGERGQEQVEGEDAVLVFGGRVLGEACIRSRSKRTASIGSIECAAHTRSKQTRRTRSRFSHRLI